MGVAAVCMVMFCLIQVRVGVFIFQLDMSNGLQC